MNDTRKAVSAVVEAVLCGAKSAVKFLDKRTTVKATYQGSRRRRSAHSTLLLTLGRPNFREREILKRAKGRIPKDVVLKFEKKKKK